MGERDRETIRTLGDGLGEEGLKEGPPVSKGRGEGPGEVGVGGGSKTTVLWARLAERDRKPTGTLDDGEG